MSSLTVDIAGVMIRLADQAEHLAAFKVEVALTYVIGDVITRPEHRIDDMVTLVREEMKETREETVQAFLERCAPSGRGS